jgi:predicted metal-dependent RNase
VTSNPCYSEFDNHLTCCALAAITVAIMASKRKASALNATVAEEPVDPADELMFLCLGGGNEVGRSCHVVQYKGKTVMVSK